ncbi:hypothetical protein D0N43_01890 [Klebsiella aerogenes]|nr:hypothetical protein D0N43_01890 [Klebsiella aerogenes]RNT11275.1 hypothetical protein B9Z99_019750 [Klebsiella aerogenes]
MFNVNARFKYLNFICEFFIYYFLIYLVSGDKGGDLSQNGLRSLCITLALMSVFWLVVFGGLYLIF